MTVHSGFDIANLTTTGMITTSNISAGTITTSSLPKITVTADELIDLAEANFLLDPESPPTPRDIIEFVRELGVIVKE
jgi:hypothetical protein